MVCVFHQNEIFDSIVLFVKIDVMHDISFWNIAMCKNPDLLVKTYILAIQRRHFVPLHDFSILSATRRYALLNACAMRRGETRHLLAISRNGE